jgi:hypothetical protein
MKREGRQHGMVRTYRILPSPVNPRPETRAVNKFDSTPTAGLFTKVPSKPTNHSKFTGKCGTQRCNGCHVNPACKSKPKTKGAQKLKSCDVVVSSRLISWRVVDGQPGLNFSGVSATDLLDHVSGDYINDDEVYDDDFEYDGTMDFESPYTRDNEIKVEINHEDGEEDNKSDNISYCDVDFVLDQVEGEEGWCLVEEM